MKKLGYENNTGNLKHEKKKSINNKEMSNRKMEVKWSTENDIYLAHVWKVNT